MALCSTKQLCEWLGYEQPGRVKRWLKENQVPFTEGKDGPITTEEAVNAALFSKRQTMTKEKITFG